MVEITLNTPDDFLKIRETLTRIGIANNTKKIIWQSCHILQKQGKYFIVHFKELLKLDGRIVDITDEDIKRRNNIAGLLEDWGLCNIVSDVTITDEHNFRVISFQQKKDWTLVHKYKIGN
ncbi:translational repressor of early genes [Providencia phage PSTRCR_127]|nr:translational repressor of early genes [Providencia phage PSTRCR_127]QQV88915.1 translational repressor of early genes [Providencia phage PSTRCR_121]UGO50075.1 putative translational repressor [Morganella phage vB_MmoM_Rgz1]